MQVSQFTLYALAKGNKPDYHLAMPPTKVRYGPSFACFDEGLSMKGQRDPGCRAMPLSVRHTGPKWTLRSEVAL